MTAARMFPDEGSGVVARRGLGASRHVARTRISRRRLQAAAAGIPIAMDVVSRITDTSTPEEVALVVRHLSQGRARVNGSFGGRTLRLLDDDILDDYFIWDDDASSEDRQDFINSLATMAGRVASVYLEANPRGRAAPYAIVSVSRAHSLAHHGDVVHVAAYERAGLFDPEQQVPLPGALPELDERASG